MARRKFKSKLIKKSDIKEKMYLLSDISNTDYITKSGKIYKNYGNDLFYLKKSYISKSTGYIYIGITIKENKNKSFRLHILLAKKFIKNNNSNKYKFVGHLDNDKTNFSLSNLYWTDASENTKKAFDDGLIKNKKGIDDSQSYPISCYRNDKKFISSYGSIKEAGRCINGYSASGIYKVVDKCKKGRKGYYFKRISLENTIILK